MLRGLIGPAAAVGGVALGLAAGLLRVLPAQPPPIRIEVPTPAPSPAPPFILVHISGAVWRPGLVQVREGARVADAVGEAGGLRTDAEPAAINLARRVRDGEHVHVPSQKEALEGEAGPEGWDDGPLDLNTANAAELDALPGIGPALTSRILAYRDQVGGFLEVDELLEVKGIGESLLAELQGLVVVH